MLIVSVQEVSLGLGQEYFFGGEGAGGGYCLPSVIEWRKVSINRHDDSPPDLDYVLIYVGPYRLFGRTHTRLLTGSCGGARARDGRDCHS